MKVTVSNLLTNNASARAPPTLQQREAENQRYHAAETQAAHGERQQREDEEYFVG